MVGTQRVWGFFHCPSWEPRGYDNSYQYTYALCKEADVAQANDRHLRLGRLDVNRPLVADSIHTASAQPSNYLKQWYYVTKDPGFWAAVHLRHTGLADVLFPDGRVAAVGTDIITKAGFQVSTYRK